MKKYKQYATEITPEITLSPEENTFVISGNSAPEDVRSIYYPVLDWLKEFAAWVRQTKPYSDRKPLVLKFDLEYFNSSSAKFFYDIIIQLNELNQEGVPVVIEWHYDADDTDLREAGEDLALLCEVQFRYCPESRGQ